MSTNLEDFYSNPDRFILCLLGIICQVCCTPTDRITRHPDGWLICDKCDSCVRCGKRSRDCECVL